MSARDAGSSDVVVVGAGIAGLVAAGRIAEGGASAVVLEARDRVGGRTWSTEIGGSVFDLGGQWLGPTQDRMMRLVSELGIDLFPTFHQGIKILDDRGRRSTYRGSIPSLSPFHLAALQLTMTRAERLCRQVDPVHPEHAARAERWDGLTLDAWLRRNVPSPPARRLLEAGIRVVFGAETAELSMLHFLAYLSGGGGLLRLIEIENGAQQDRFVQGAQSVALGLAKRLGERVRFGAAARSIEQDSDGVTVRTDRETWRARAAIVAVPPALAGRIAYEPALPFLRDQLTQRFPMGATTKCHAIYDRAFWREAGHSGEAVCTGGPVTVVFDNTSHDGKTPALLAFLVGRPAREAGRLAPPERRRRVLETLTEWFGPRAADPVEYVEQDWSLEPWTRGCPTASPAPGALTVFGAALREPAGRIHWAGTETAREWAGYMEGAAESGERAATEVLARL